MFVEHSERERAQQLYFVRSRTQIESEMKAEENYHEWHYFISHPEKKKRIGLYLSTQ
jgi:hypothetical protein